MILLFIRAAMLGDMIAHKMFYQSYVLPLIDYGSSSWGSTTKLNIDRINKLQKRAARIILKVDYLTTSVEMFQRLTWMTVSQRINYNWAVLTYSALNNLTPAYISDLLTWTAITDILGHQKRLINGTKNQDVFLHRLIYSFSP